MKKHKSPPPTPQNHARIKPQGRKGKIFNANIRKMECFEEMQKVPVEENERPLPTKNYTDNNTDHDVFEQSANANARLPLRSLTSFTCIQRIIKTLNVRKCIVLTFAMMFILSVSIRYLSFSVLDNGMLNSTFTETFSLVEEKNDSNEQFKRTDQEFIIIVASPGVGFDSVESDLTLWSKQYILRPYAYSLVRRRLFHFDL